MKPVVSPHGRWSLPLAKRGCYTPPIILGRQVEPDIQCVSELIESKYANWGRHLATARAALYQSVGRDWDGGNACFGDGA